MTRYVAVIDIGKTNAKVALVDNLLATESEVIRQRIYANTTTLYPSLNHSAIEDFIVEALVKLSKNHKIDALTVTTHGATVALIDRAGELALPILDYEFQDVDELRSVYEKLRPPFADTGSPALPGGLNIGAQLHWQQTKYPKEFATVHTILTWPQYWVFRLTGERYNDVSSLGVHTDLYEPERQRCSKLVEERSWTSLMPPTRLSGELSGTLTPHIAKRTHLPSTTPVYTGIHDSNASLVPHLTTQKPPFTVISTGTWFIVMAIGGTGVVLDETRDTLLNVNAYGKSVPSARFMGGRERELLGVTSNASEQSMTQLLSDTLKPAMLLPSVVTGTGPFPHTKAHWIGKSIENDTKLRDCAVTLYLAMMSAECMQLIGSEGNIFIEGPLAHDIHYAKMLAAITERRVILSDSQTGTSVGAAMLINPPEKSPPSHHVSIDNTLCAQLQHYAKLWRNNLTLHSR